MKIIGHTSRILLRETTPNDAKAVFDLNNDPEVIKYTGDPPFSSIGAARLFLKSYDHFEKYQRGRWAVCDKMTNEFLGWCGLKYHEDNGENDLGYRLYKKEWNKGYTTEASHLALQYGFRRLGLDSIIARADKANGASLKVMQKLGLSYEMDFIENGHVFKQYRIDKYSYMLQEKINNEIVVY